MKPRRPVEHPHHHRIRTLLIAVVIGCIGIAGVMWYSAWKRQPPNPVEQTQFIQSILTSAEKNNQTILKQRHHLRTLYMRVMLHKEPLDYLQTVEFHHLVNAYQIKKADPNKSQTWHELFERINIVPNSLIISQAIIESAWGRSRFAIQANNYFGQACFTADCGAAPTKKDGTHREVEFFSGLDSSVQSYIRNINTNPAYADFRAERSRLQQDHHPITGSELVGTLTAYSTEHQIYIGHVHQIIQKFELSKYDKMDSLPMPEK
jgi:Bax protein